MTSHDHRHENDRDDHDDDDPDHDHHHGHRHDHRHGHAHDQGWRGMARYLRLLPRMWRSVVNDTVVAMLDPRPGERCVDIGAGMGAGTMRAAATGAQVVAVDPTPYMRRITGVRRLVGGRRSTVVVADGSAEAIPVADASVDVVWAVNTMHHWADIDRGVAEIFRVLKADGRALLVDEAFTDESHPDHERFGTRDDRHEHGFSVVDADAMVARFHAAGLTSARSVDRRIADRPVVGVAVGVTSDVVA